MHEKQFFSLPNHIIKNLIVCFSFMRDRITFYFMSAKGLEKCEHSLLCKMQFTTIMK